MTEIIIVYIFLFLASGIIAGLVYEDGNKQLGARMALLMPVWPLMAVYGLVVLVRHLWKRSGWSGWTEKLRK